jgi:hypothetical protein
MFQIYVREQITSYRTAAVMAGKGTPWDAPQDQWRPPAPGIQPSELHRQESVVDLHEWTARGKFS